jgi:hypothetical protein
MLRALRAGYLILAGTLVLGLLLEVGWRIVHRPDSAGVSVENVRYTLHPYFQSLPPPAKIHQRGPFLAGWLVHPPDAALAKGRFRILFLGGSTTASKYPELVREELEKSIGPTTIYNLGFPWHCSLHSLYKIWTYADDLQPDLIVDLEVLNDFYRGFTPPAHALPVYRPDYSHYSGALHMFWSPGRSRFDGRDAFYARPLGEFGKYEARDESLPGLFRSFVRGSALLHALDLRVDEPLPRAREDAADPEETALRSLHEFEINLGNIAASCRAKGFPLLLLTMPYTTGSSRLFLKPGGFFTNDGVRVLSDAGFARGMDRFNEAVLAMKQEPAVRVLPLAGEIRDPALFEDEVHLTFDGQRREAQLVARYILDQGLLREPRNR